MTPLLRLALLMALVAGCCANTDTDDAELRAGKIVLICVVGVATLGASVLPWYIRRLRNSLLVMDVCCCLAAGIMLGAALCHIFPDATKSFETYLELHDDAGASSEPAGHDHGAFPYHFVIAGAVLLLLVAVDSAVAHQGKQFQAHAHAHGTPYARIADPSEGTYGSSSVGVPVGAELDYTVKGQEEQRGGSRQILEAWVFFGALSLHSIFDGLSIGAENDLSGFYSLMAAVLSHKLLDGFALGVPVYYANFSKLHTAFALTFCAAMTPLGIGLGWAITAATEGEAAILAKALIMSISGGSFLFISLMELLPTGLESGEMPITKMVVCSAGFAIMALIALWV